MSGAVPASRSSVEKADLQNQIAERLEHEEALQKTFGEAKAQPEKSGPVPEPPVTVAERLKQKTPEPWDKIFSTKDQGSDRDAKGANKPGGRTKPDFLSAAFEAACRPKRTQRVGPSASLLLR
jgi:hypothetical protein